MIKIKKIKPMFNSLITTMDEYDSPVYTAGGIIDGSKKTGAVKEYQKVIEVGPMVRDIKVGDVVCINPSRFAVMKHQKGSLKDGVIGDNPVVGYNFNVVEMDDSQCLLLQDRDIDFVVSEYEEIPDPEPSKLYKPGEKSVIC